MRHLLLIAVAAAGCATPPRPVVVHTVPTSRAPLATEHEEDDLPIVVVRLEHIQRADEVDVNVTLPILVSSDPELAGALATINADLRSVSQRSIAELERAAAEQTSAPAHPFTFDMTCRPALLSRALVSVACSAWFYAGGAHGMYGTTGHNYVLEAGSAESVALPEILADQNSGTATVAAYAYAELRERGAMLIESGIVPSLEAKDLNNFTFTPDGLVLHFAPYVVGSYAEGEYDVTIDHEHLKPLLGTSGAGRAVTRSRAPGLKVVLDYEPS